MMKALRFPERYVMRGSDNRVPLLTAIFMALLFAAIPGPAEAQLGGSSNTFNAQTCIQNQQNAYTNHAQAQTTARVKVFSNATNPSMSLVYCWNTIQNIFNTIGTLTSGANLLGSFIWAIVLQAITGLLNQVCAAVVGAITSAINMLKNLLCVPIPHFNLGLNFSLGSFGGGTCNGVSLLSLGSTSAAARAPFPAGYSPLWNYTPSLSSP
jgi:hypothetical protein